MIINTAPTTKCKVLNDTIAIPKHDSDDVNYVEYKFTHYACQHCNFDRIDRNDKFCSRCGYKLNWRGIPKGK